jgi:hypothetical protein
MTLETAEIDDVLRRESPPQSPLSNSYRARDLELTRDSWTWCAQGSRLRCDTGGTF